MGNRYPCRAKQRPQRFAPIRVGRYLQAVQIQSALALDVATNQRFYQNAQYTLQRAARQGLCEYRLRSLHTRYQRR